MLGQLILLQSQEALKHSITQERMVDLTIHDNKLVLSKRSKLTFELFE